MLRLHKRLLLTFARSLFCLNFQIGSPLSQILQPYLHTLRQTIIYRGLGDVVYYCSDEGKVAVQVAVYGCVLNRLEYYRREEPDTKIRLHIIAHSLGVTVVANQRSIKAGVICIEVSSRSSSTSTTNPTDSKATLYQLGIILEG